MLGVACQPGESPFEEWQARLEFRAVPLAAQSESVLGQLMRHGRCCFYGKIQTLDGVGESP